MPHPPMIENLSGIPQSKFLCLKVLVLMCMIYIQLALSICIMCCCPSFTANHDVVFPAELLAYGLNEEVLDQVFSEVQSSQSATSEGFLIMDSTRTCIVL